MKCIPVRPGYDACRHDKLVVTILGQGEPAVPCQPDAVPGPADADKHPEGYVQAASPITGLFHSVICSHTNCFRVFRQVLGREMRPISLSSLACCLRLRLAPSRHRYPPRPQATPLKCCQALAACRHPTRVFRQYYSSRWSSRYSSAV